MDPALVVALIVVAVTGTVAWATWVSKTLIAIQVAISSNAVTLHDHGRRISILETLLPRHIPSDH